MSETTQTFKRTMNTRISLKIDTWANWHTESKGANLILARGEVAFVQVGTDIPPVVHTETGTELITNPNTVLFKVGDGTTPFKSLNWGSAIAADVYDWAKVKEEDFYKKLTGKETVTCDETFVTTTEFNQTINDMKDATKSGSLAKLISDLTAATTGDGEDSLASRLSVVEELAGIGGDSGTGALATVQYVNDQDAILLGNANTKNTIKGAQSTADAAEAKLTGLAKDTVQEAITDAVTIAKNAVIGDADSTKDSDTVKGAKLFATDADDVLKNDLLGNETSTANTITGVGKIADEAKSKADTATAQLTGLVSDETTSKTVQGAINKAKTDAKTELVGTATVTGIDGNALTAPSFTESTDAPHTITGAKKYAYDLVKNLLTAYILDDNSGAIDKLNEIAAWIDGDKNGVADIITDIGNKLDKSTYDAFVADTGAFGVLKKTVDDNKDNWNTAYDNAKDLTNHEVLKDIDADDVSTWNTVTSKASQTDLDKLEADAFTEADVFYIDCGTSTVNAFLVENEAE